MKKVIILGASGNIAAHVIDFLKKDNEIQLTLFARSSKRIKNKDISNCKIIEGDVLNRSQITEAIKGNDIVYANLAGELEAMANKIVSAMKETGVQKIIFISSIGIYDTPLRSILQPYRKAADIFEGSGLNYTILRPNWFSNEEEVDYEVTEKGSPEKGSVISQKSLATLIYRIILSPAEYEYKNLGVNKPV